ncbi:hypothetical protein, partial [Devosia indica]
MTRKAGAWVLGRVRFPSRSNLWNGWRKGRVVRACVDFFPLRLFGWRKGRERAQTVSGGAKKKKNESFFSLLNCLGWSKKIKGDKKVSFSFSLPLFVFVFAAFIIF